LIEFSDILKETDLSVMGHNPAVDKQNSNLSHNHNLFKPDVFSEKFVLIVFVLFSIPNTDRSSVGLKHSK